MPEKMILQIVGLCIEQGYRGFVVDGDGEDWPLSIVDDETVALGAKEIDVYDIAEVHVLPWAGYVGLIVTRYY